MAPTDQLIELGLVGAGLLASCVGISHELWGVAAVNATDTAIVIREGRSKWLVPANGSGHLFGNIADGAPPETHDYEILDATTCELLGTQRIVLDAPGTHVVTVQPDGSIALAPFDPSIQNIQLGSADGACPGEADGWSLWVANPTLKTYYLRNGNEVARVSPNSTAAAVAGYSESSVIELFDADCGLLEVVPRSGWGPVKGTILDDHLTLDAGVAPPPPLGSFNLVAKCKFSAGEASARPDSPSAVP